MANRVLLVGDDGTIPGLIKVSDENLPAGTRAADIAAKADASHRHPWSDLDSVPATFTPETHAHAAATSAAAGFMPAADKAKLDAATWLPTGGTLAVRHASGAINVETGSGAKDAANKAYVDGKGFARAAGTVAVPVLAAGATTTITVTFPASRFTVAPIFNLDTGDGRVTVGSRTTTATSSTVTICNYTAAASVATTGQWQAVQMASGAAAG